MTTDTGSAPASPAWDIRSPVLDTWFPIVAAIATLLVGGATILLSVPLGMLVCAAVTVVLCIARPMDMPVFIVSGFIFQNLVVAYLSPSVGDESLFNMLRGMNFVILAMAFAAFVVAAMTRQWSDHPQARRWVIATLALSAVIALYLLIGMARGVPMDAIVYFRNTIAPVACFLVGFLVVLLYRFDSVPGLIALGIAAAVYGYCELFFTLDFMSLFNGDTYITMQMRRQIESGQWERILQETGFVFRGLGDTFMTNLFNLPMFSDIQVWRIAGPNFHPISYAYSLSIVSVVLLSRGQWMLPLLLLPLLLIVGSKGALVLLVIAAAGFVLLRYAGPRLAGLFVLVAALVWVGAAIIVGMRSGDYHVLGFFAGVRDFLSNPVGEGLGIGGNLSSDSANLDWNAAQASGATDVPVESAVGVMLYQMGIGSFAFFGLLFAMAATLLKRLLATSHMEYLAAFTMVVVVSANAVLQEEAYYSPLALGFILLIAGGTLARAITPAASMAKG
jgi:hypothetical protein